MPATEEEAAEVVPPRFRFGRHEVSDFPPVAAPPGKSTLPRVCENEYKPQMTP